MRPGNPLQRIHVSSCRKNSVGDNVLWLGCIGIRCRVGDPVEECVGLPFTIGIVTVFLRSISHLTQCLFQHVEIGLCALRWMTRTLILSRWTSLPATSPSHPHPSLVCISGLLFFLLHSRCDVPLMTLPMPISVLKGPRPLDESNLDIEQVDQRDFFE